ncbi:histidinol dehydrogenase [Streptococcus acidominimus]|uniref:Histidinol dehydrogenase n=1 Tax=Streptococcus acidominimus TaxID=1326 RepID=A0A239X2C1_STRAI|nr:histidinol dehydrogenase [Streptococcus acidominimus]
MKRLSGTSQDIAALLYQEQVALNAETVSVEEIVKEIVARVAREGDAALKAYNLQFDGIGIDDLEVSQAQIDAAFEQIEPDILSALESAKANIASYHQQQVEEGFEDQPSKGVLRGQLIRPLERVGVYVPGGTAAYPSSVLMNVIPAKIAGVEEIIMITPP